MSEEYEDESPFEINYDNVISCKDCLSVTRLLAVDLKENPYMSVGLFLKNISNSDLKILSDIVDQNFNIDDDDEVGDPSLADVVLIAEMLSRAEGIISESDEQLMQKVNQFMMYISVESLRRKGLVRVYHENMSFGEDAEKRVVVEKIEGKDYED
jgi:hypothetical protein